MQVYHSLELYNATLNVIGIVKYIHLSILFQISRSLRNTRSLVVPSDGKSYWATSNDMGAVLCTGGTMKKVSKNGF